MMACSLHHSSLLRPRVRVAAQATGSGGGGASFDFSRVRICPDAGAHAPPERGPRGETGPRPEDAPGACSCPPGLLTEEVQPRG